MGLSWRTVRQLYFGSRPTHWRRASGAQWPPPLASRSAPFFGHLFASSSSWPSS